MDSAVITDEDEDKPDKSIPKSVRKVSKGALTETTQKIKIVFREMTIPISKPNIKPTGINIFDYFFF